MNTPRLQLRHLCFLGPSSSSEPLKFGAGLNVLYGASDTGKSFAVEAIDFMLGGSLPLRPFKERAPFHSVLLGIEVSDGRQFTLQRSCDGGGYLLFEGLHVVAPPLTPAPAELSDVHSEKNADNISTFLLSLCGLSGRRVLRNKDGETQSLGFRALAKQVIVSEMEIIEQRSPLQDGNPTADTANFATFRFLLSGLDDSAMVRSKRSSPEHLSREGQIDLLGQLLDEQRRSLPRRAKDANELQDQLARIDESLARLTEEVKASEAEYRDLSARRRNLREGLEEARDRRAEIAGLLQRFTLLHQHYESDLARLQAIEEGGTLFEILGPSSCPLCGAAQTEHRPEIECDANVDAVVRGAQSEAKKIRVLRKELVETGRALMREGDAFDERIPLMDRELERLSTQIEAGVGRQLATRRNAYAEFVDKRAQVRESLRIHAAMTTIEERKAKLEAAAASADVGAGVNADLLPETAQEFAKHIESILAAWHFPNATPVHFDSKARDLVIGGKSRRSSGKGLRAVTRAGFTLGLLDYCLAHNLPHPGFVVLDSPLLAYRKPEGPEDSLAGTDLDERFYEYLHRLPADRQILIVENRNPPPSTTNRPQSLMFSKNISQGRYGLFPPVPQGPAETGEA